MRRSTLNRRGRLLFCGLALVGLQAFAKEEPPLKDDQEKISYALGLDLGVQMRSVSVELNPAIFARGLSAGLSGESALMTQDEARLQISKLQADLRDRQIEAMKRAREEAAKPGEAALGETRPAEDSRAAPPPISPEAK